MFFSNDRENMRRSFFIAWQKHHHHEILTPLEEQLVRIIMQHPEYHFIFDAGDLHLKKDYTAAEGNPFLHFSLHQGLHEQVHTDRPAGIRAIYQALCQKMGDVHTVEHLMMSVLLEALQESQMTGSENAMQRYLEQLRKLA